LFILNAIVWEPLYALIVLTPFLFLPVLFVKAGDQKYLLHSGWECMIDFYSGVTIFTVIFPCSFSNNANL